MKDREFTEALFSENELYECSPIVINVVDEESEKFVWGLLEKYNVKTHLCGEHYEIENNLPVAFLALQDIERDLPAQARLAKYIDYGRLSQQTVYVITHKHINDLYLLGRLRARLLCGVYTELQGDK